MMLTQHGCGHHATHAALSNTISARLHAKSRGHFIFDPAIELTSACVQNDSVIMVFLCTSNLSQCHGVYIAGALCYPPWQQDRGPEIWTALSHPQLASMSYVKMLHIAAGVKLTSTSYGCDMSHLAHIPLLGRSITGKMSMVFHNPKHMHGVLSEHCIPKHPEGAHHSLSLVPCCSCALSLLPTGRFELGQAPTTKEAQAIADALYSEFVGEDVDKVELVYTKFVSLISSDPIIQTLLPLTPQVRLVSEIKSVSRAWQSCHAT